MRTIVLSGTFLLGWVAFATPGHAGDAVKHRFLATDSGKSRLIYVDQFHPDKDWSAKTPPGPRDIRLVDGNKVLISHRRGAAVYDLKTGRQTWLLDSYGGIESALRLPNGNTLLGGNTPKGIVLYEVDAAGKEVRKVLVEGKHDL